MKPRQPDLSPPAPSRSRRGLRALLRGLLPALSGCVLTALMSLPALAQPTAGGIAGLEDLPIFAPENLSVEINLSGSLLKMVAGSVAAEDPEFASLISGLRGIRVRVSELDEPLENATSMALRDAVAGLPRLGWKSLIRMQEDGEEVFIYLKEDGEKIDSLLVVFLDTAGEAGLIHVDGTIDLTLLGRLMSNLDGEHLGELSEKLRQPLEEAPPAEEPAQ